jgi:hypothetical protein
MGFTASLSYWHAAVFRAPGGKRRDFHASAHALCRTSLGGDRLDYRLLSPQAVLPPLLHAVLLTMLLLLPAGALNLEMIPHETAGIVAEVDKEGAVIRAVSAGTTITRLA